MLPLIQIALSLTGQFAPAIVKYLSGSDAAAAVAGQVVGIAQTVTCAATPEAAQVALQADQKLAADFQLAVLAIESELAQMHLADTQNARQRDIVLAQAGIKNHRANVLAGAALLLVVACLMVVIWNADANDFVKATISLILGRALGWVEQLFSFEYGTNRASKVKDDTIGRLSGK